MSKNLIFNIFFIFIIMVTKTNASQNEIFSIYLTAEKIPFNDFFKINLKNVKLKEKPIISSDDIISYSGKTHQIELTPASYERIMQLDVGTPFVICVGSERLYMGVIWSDLRSASFNGIVISKPSMRPRNTIIQLKKGYPSEKYFKGDDPRSNSKIFRALKRVHKLS